MNIQLKEIDRSNYQECIDLKVNSDQQNYVAPNIVSLVEAAYEPDLYPLGIYDDEKFIGFILFDFDKEINGWSMSRFMIGNEYQGKGYGKESLKVFLAFFKAKFGNVTLYTSAELENEIAIHLYEAFGFKRQNNFEYEHKGKLYRETRMVLEANR